MSHPQNNPFARFEVLPVDRWSMLTDVVFDEPDPSADLDGLTDLSMARGYIGDRSPRLLADTAGLNRGDTSSIMPLMNFYKKLRDEYPLDNGSPMDLQPAIRGDHSALVRVIDAFTARPKTYGVQLSVYTDIKAFREGDMKAGAKVLAFLETFYANRPMSTQFRFSHGDMTFRCKRKVRYDGTVRLTMRRIPQRVPVLDQLRFANPYVPKLMLSPDLLRGGLVLVIAPVGQGKTTTITAAMKTRHLIYGGQSATIEDPVESYLDGWHGFGECVQTQVDPARPPEETFPEAFRDSLRDFATSPSGGIMVHVSEIRDPATASSAIAAAQSGYLVIATTHSDTIPDAIQRIISFASMKVGEKTAKEALGSCLRMVLLQQLELSMKPDGWRRGTLTGQIMYSSGADSAVGSVIATKQPVNLNEEINRQNALLTQGLRGSTAWPKVFAELGGRESAADIPEGLTTDVYKEYLATPENLS